MDDFVDILIAVGVIVASALGDQLVKWFKGRAAAKQRQQPERITAESPRRAQASPPPDPADWRKGFTRLVDSLPEEGQRVTVAETDTAATPESLTADSRADAPCDADQNRLDRLRENLIMGEILTRKF